MANGRANGQIKIMDGGHWSTKSDFISIQMFNSNLVLQIKRKKKKKARFGEKKYWRSSARFEYCKLRNVKKSYLHVPQK